jgi:hypothetical protein
MFNGSYRGFSVVSSCVTPRRMSEAIAVAVVSALDGHGNDDDSEEVERIIFGLTVVTTTTSNGATAIDSITSSGTNSMSNSSDALNSGHVQRLLQSLSQSLPSQVILPHVIKRIIISFGLPFEMVAAAIEEQLLNKRLSLFIPSVCSWIDNRSPTPDNSIPIIAGQQPNDINDWQQSSSMAKRRLVIAQRVYEYWSLIKNRLMTDKQANHN